MHLDVATGGELHVALAAGVPADRLVLHGNNKSLDELREARAAGVGRIVVDSFDELDRLAALHAEDGLAPEGARPGHARASRPTPTTSSAPVRSTRSSASAWRPATPRARSPAPRTRRPSSWSACTCTSAARCSSPTSSTRRWRWWRRGSREVGLPELSIGGGLGVAYVEGEEAPSITEWGDGHRVGLPGRGHHGAGDGRAGPVDRRPGRRHALHGRHDQGRARRAHLRVRRRRHVRQPAAGALRLRLRGVPARGPPTPTGPKRVTIVGKHCESGDVLVRDAQVPDDLRRRRRPRHPGHRRLRPLDGLQLQQGAAPGGGVRGRGPGARGRAAGDLRRPPPPRRGSEPVGSGLRARRLRWRP